MRTYRLASIAAAGILMLSGCASTPRTPAAPQSPPAPASAQAPLPLIPMPAHVQRSAGHFTLRQGATLLVQSDNAKALAIAHQFAALLARTRGIHLNVQALTGAADTDGSIVFSLDHDDTRVSAGEGYQLSVDGSHIRVAARKAAGLYYGSVTLWQLLTPEGPHTLPMRVPNVRIADQPRFAWRGLMLDSARHFQSVADIKRLIDWMSLHKLNVLHWHLTDDQGWRLQIKRYPKLTSIGACRKAVGPDAALTGGPDKPYCGFYTQAQVRDLVRYAQRHFITIVPEIEIPGHAQAAVAAYPGLGVTGKRPSVSTDWGVNTWLYAPDKHSLHFLENVLDEVMTLFPSTYIHVGGDEAAKDQWKASPQVQAHMKALGLHSENAMQGWMIAQIGQYLAQHGRRLIGWDEILQGGGLPPDAAVMSWRGIKGAIKAANMGHDVVLSPSPTMYLDHLQTRAHSEPPGRPQVISLKDVYDFNPLPKKIDAVQAKHVLGLQLNLWAEYMPTFARDQHAIFPRLAAESEVAWSPAATHGWASFKRRLPAQLARYRALGIGYDRAAFTPQLSAVADGAHQVRVKLHTQIRLGSLHYTTDGRTPTRQSPSYTGALTLPLATTLRATAFDPAGHALGSLPATHIDTAWLHRRSSDRLTPCTHKIVLRLEDDRPLHGKRPAYNLDITNPCWLWKNAPLDGERRIAVRVGNLPWNFALWKDASAVKVRPVHTPHGALQVHADSCSGPLLARMSLAEASRTRGQTTLRATLPAMKGRHDLCFEFTGDPRKTLWAIDTVQLQ